MALRKRESGYCEVSTRRGGAWHLERRFYGPLLTAWSKGVQRVSAIDFYGSALTVDLTDVDSITDVTPEAVMARLEDARQNEADDSMAV